MNTGTGFQIGTYLAALAVAASLCLVPGPGAGPVWAAPDDHERRAEMLEEIRRNVRETDIYLDKERLAPRVMAAMAEVPRHRFVPEAEREHAYENRPLPIGHGQTISQPYIVAVMTDLLAPRANHRVLEVGTGSGYQAAVLSRLVDQVYTIEIIEPLAERARRSLATVGYDNVHVRQGDGYYGWPEQAPFDAIVVTAAATHVPPPLVEQLKPGGRMVIPVGSGFLVQQMVVVEKDPDGRLTTRQVLPVAFVPLTGGHEETPSDRDADSTHSPLKH